MADLLPWRFVAFALVFALLVYLQFYLAHRRWNRLKGEEATEIDVNYVRSENYLAQSFRRKVKEWLQLPATVEEGGRFIVKGRERIRVTGPLDLPAREQCDDILVVDGDFSCGPECCLVRELCISGNASIGNGSRLQSLAADGDLRLADSVTVARWVDSAGAMTIGGECSIGARVTSLKSIRLAVGARVASAYAPEVGSVGWRGDVPADEPASCDLLEIVVPEDPDSVDSSLSKARLNPRKFVQLSPECWLYKGDFLPSAPVRVTKKLVIKGNCLIPAKSVLEADMKVSGSLSVGPFSVCKGNLIADGYIYLARGCRFYGLVHSAQSALLSQGVRGFRPGEPLAVFAEENLFLEPDVVVRGKLSSHGGVVVIGAGKAEIWRARFGARDNEFPAPRVSHTA